MLEETFPMIFMLEDHGSHGCTVLMNTKVGGMGVSKWVYIKRVEQDKTWRQKGPRNHEYYLPKYRNEASGRSAISPFEVPARMQGVEKLGLDLNEIPYFFRCPNSYEKRTEDLFERVNNPWLQPTVHPPRAEAKGVFC